MIEAQESPLDPAAVVAADGTLEQGWRTLRGTGAPLLVLEGAGRLRVVPEDAVRSALYHRAEPTASLAELVDPRLVVATRDAATIRLAAERRLRAVAVPADTGPVLVERVLPPVKDAVVMAGGFGTRLRPLTDETPKPLLEIAGRPLLCRILDALRDAGVERVAISVHYLADQVRDAIGDGSEWGLSVRYLEEAEPLGTGAGLALLGQVAGPFLLLNGDILTDLDLRDFARHHLLHENLVTVATCMFSTPLPYGVVHQDAERIRHIDEKPVYRYPVNAGLYVFEREVLERVVPGQPLAMVDFLNEHAGRARIGSFELVEYWNDVGSHADYRRAQEEVARL